MHLTRRRGTTADPDLVRELGQCPATPRAPQVGWEVRARDASGRDVRLYAWRARVLPA